MHPINRPPLKRAFGAFCFALGIALPLAGCGGGGGAGGEGAGASVQLPAPAVRQLTAANARFVSGNSTLANNASGAPHSGSTRLGSSVLMFTIGAPITATTTISFNARVTLVVGAGGFLGVQSTTGNTTRTTNITPQAVTLGSGAAVLTTNFGFRQYAGSGSISNAFFLTAEYAANAILPVLLSASFADGTSTSFDGVLLFHYGERAPVSIFARGNRKATYRIPAHAAMGFYYRINEAQQGLTRNLFLSNKTAGQLIANLGASSGYATLHLTLAAYDKEAEFTDFVKISNMQMRITRASGQFSNAHCRGSGSGTSSTNCAGTLAYGIVRRHGGTLTNAVAGSVSATNYQRLSVGGGFYGPRAEEVAGRIAYQRYFNAADTRLPNDNYNIDRIDVGFIGRGQFSSPSRTANASAAGDVLARAEYAAFSAVQEEGGAYRIVHSGTRAAAAVVVAHSDSATYRISVGGAGGVYSASGGNAVSLVNTAPGELQVDFARNIARLDLSVQDDGGNSYALEEVGLQLQAGSNAFDFCADCSGRVRGSGELAGFNTSNGLQINGAFYGNTAQNAAAALHHVQSGVVVDLGFVGVQE